MNVTQNAFSDKLCRLAFNLFAMLVVDLLHEFELGVWKAIFTHLLRMLQSLEESKVHELDRRFAPISDFATVSSCPSDIGKSRHLDAILFDASLKMRRT